MGAALDLARSWASWLIATPWRIVLSIFTTALSYGIYKLLARRLMFRRLQAQGIPIMTHSLLFGHLPVLRAFYKTHPRDVNTSSKIQTWLGQNRHIYFPHLCSSDTPEPELPPMIYLDFYPLIPFPMAITFSPSLSSQVLLPHPEVGLPQGITRGPTQKMLFEPLTGQRDLFCMEGSEWKSWRGRMGWAFSHRNVSALVGEGMVEEGVVFARGLERMCKKKKKTTDGGDDDKNMEGEEEGWGEMFQMMERTSSLTMDVIARALLDIRLHDQTTPFGGAPAKKALMDTIKRFPTYFSYKEKFLRFFGLPSANVTAINKNRVVLDGFLNPGIDAVLTTNPREQGSDGRAGVTKERKTVVQQICAPFVTAADTDGPNTKSETKSDSGSAEKKGEESNTAAADILDTDTRHVILGHLKVLMFAGHDTTATTLCWMYKELQDSPSSLSKIRAEHDTVFGRPLSSTTSSSSTIDNSDSHASANQRGEREDSNEIDKNAEEREQGGGEDFISSVATQLTANPALLNALPYTIAVIRETLRLHPPGPILRHHDSDPGKEYKLVHTPEFHTSKPETTQTYPTFGFAILDGHHHIHACEEYFERAGDFVPERWLPHSDVIEPADVKYFRGFGLGPRSCIGTELAMAELKLAAALTMRMFDVREAWAVWDEKVEREEAVRSEKGGKSGKRNGKEKKEKPMLNGQRLYPTGVGPAHLKDDMPVQVRLARR